MTDWMSLPYRMNVGAVLFGPDGRVLVGRRAGFANAAWQLPQGGIDDGEDPRTAVLRELLEEIGTANAEILSEHDRGGFVAAWLQHRSLAWAADIIPDLPAAGAKS